MSGFAGKSQSRLTRKTYKKTPAPFLARLTPAGLAKAVILGQVSTTVHRRFCVWRQANESSIGAALEMR